AVLANAPPDFDQVVFKKHAADPIIAVEDRLAQGDTAFEEATALWRRRSRQEFGGMRIGWIMGKEFAVFGVNRSGEHVRLGLEGRQCFGRLFGIEEFQWRGDVLTNDV